MKKPNNRGFTLVELLIAVLILSIITVPLLHTFVTSAQMAAKSRRTGDATTAAQNIVETVEASGVSDVLSTAESDFSDVAALFGPGVTANVVPDGTNGGGTVMLTGLSSGSSTFDARVALDPSPYRDDGDINSKKITQYTAMDAVYQQKTGNLDPDTLALELFNQDHIGDTLVSQERTIQISIQKLGTSAVQAYLTFTYRFGYQGTDMAGEPTAGTQEIQIPSDAPNQYKLFPLNYPLDESAPFSIYVFFNPYYASTSAPYKDVITIENSDNLLCKVFLVKQKLPSAGTQETTYGAQVILREDHVNFTDPFQAAVFSNIGRNLATGGTIPSNISYKKYGNAVYFVNSSFGDGNLIDQEAEDRLYNVTVDIYPSGSGDSILTFRATKLQ